MKYNRMYLKCTTEDDYDEKRNVDDPRVMAFHKTPFSLLCYSQQFAYKE